MQQSQVAREQSVGKDGVLLAQAMQGAAAQKKQVEAKDDVTRPEEPKEGTAAIKEGSGEASGGAIAQHKEEEDEEGEKTEEAQKEEVVRDPDLGTHIDLTG
ncbi:MAG: hypothetical protein ACLQMF_13190 [Rectinemataceae bacterium]